MLITDWIFIRRVSQMLFCIENLSGAKPSVRVVVSRFVTRLALQDWNDPELDRPE